MEDLGKWLIGVIKKGIMKNLRSATLWKLELKLRKLVWAKSLGSRNQLIAYSCIKCAVRRHQGMEIHQME